MSTTPTAAPHATAHLQINRAEAALLLDALKVLGNCRKFAFRDEGDSDNEQLQRVTELAARIRAAADLK